MSLGEWSGERFEYGVRGSGDQIVSYVADVDGSDAAGELIWSRLQHHRAEGVTAEVVRRRVVYGDWESVSERESGREAQNGEK